MGNVGKICGVWAAVVCVCMAAWNFTVIPAHRYLVGLLPPMSADVSYPIRALLLGLFNCIFVISIAITVRRNRTANRLWQRLIGITGAVQSKEKRRTEGSDLDIDKAVRKQKGDAQQRP